MKQKKSLQELTFKDNFMFGAVLLDPENCKGVIERSIGTEIERVEVSREKSIVYNPEYKGIRLDAYAKDENRTRYNVEMQVLPKPIFLSTKGTNEDEVPNELVKFLKFVGANLSESEKDYEDAFIQRLQTSVKEVKASREMGARYMTFQEMLKDEREAGREQELVELCQEFGKSKEETILKMMNRLHLKRKDAETRIEQYWK